jgi:mannonate dehydratase
VTPAADAAGVRLTLHPDDPPRGLFGLPRIASTAADYAALFEAVPAPSNGMCFCTGSLGVRADNDLPAIVDRFAERIHFVHLRSTKREADPRSFHEADHLAGDVDMVAVLSRLLAAEARRPAGDRMVFRPDHGHRMLDDLQKTVNPGYAAIGRLKGLAELRGILYALGAPPETSR